MTLEIIGMEIKDTTLSGRTKNALRYAGIDYVSILTHISANELLRIPNMGRKSVEEIIEFLGQFRYELKGQDKFYKRKQQLPWVVKLIEEAVAQEREACAKFIEQDYKRQFDEPWRENLAQAIRARGEA
jgi:predicted DNA-binding helix-hairpin-helix protein